MVIAIRLSAVSYTHLDVYKRQDPHWHRGGRRHHDVKIIATLTRLGQGRIVGIEISDRDLYVIGLFELRDQLGACLLYTSRCV